MMLQRRTQRLLLAGAVLLASMALSAHAGAKTPARPPLKRFTNADAEGSNVLGVYISITTGTGEELCLTNGAAGVAPTTACADAGTFDMSFVPGSKPGHWTIMPSGSEDLCLGVSGKGGSVIEIAACNAASPLPAHQWGVWSDPSGADAFYLQNRAFPGICLDMGAGAIGAPCSIAANGKLNVGRQTSRLRISESADNLSKRGTGIGFQTGVVGLAFQLTNFVADEGQVCLQSPATETTTTVGVEGNGSTGELCDDPAVAVGEAQTLSVRPVPTKKGRKANLYQIRNTQNGDTRCLSILSTSNDGVDNTAEITRNQDGAQLFWVACSDIAEYQHFQFYEEKLGDIRTGRYLVRVRGSKRCLTLESDAAGTFVVQDRCPLGFKEGSSSDDDLIVTSDNQLWKFLV